MQIKIEPVKNTEVLLLSNISAKCFSDTFAHQNREEDMRLFLNKNLTADTLTAEMLQPNNYFFFAKEGDQIAGYIKLSNSETPPPAIEEAGALEIARIYVVKDEIGRGVGKSLMNFALSFAKQYNKKLIWLGVWERNLRAINFYQSYGFEKFGEHTFMLGNDAQTDWLMKKELGE